MCVCLANRYLVEVVTTEKQAYQERENVWCWGVPPRCSKYKIKFRTVNKTQQLTKNRVVRECCGKSSHIFISIPSLRHFLLSKVNTYLIGFELHPCLRSTGKNYFLFFLQIFLTYVLRRTCF